MRKLLIKKIIESESSFSVIICWINNSVCWSIIYFLLFLSIWEMKNHWTFLFTWVNFTVSLPVEYCYTPRAYLFKMLSHVDLSLIHIWLSRKSWWEWEAGRVTLGNLNLKLYYYYYKEIKFVSLAKITSETVARFLKYFHHHVPWSLRMVFKHTF